MNSIKNVTLAGLICNNYDVAIMSKYPFLTRKTGKQENMHNDIDDLLYKMKGTHSASENIYKNNQASLLCSSLIGQIDFTKWLSTA